MQTIMFMKNSQLIELSCDHCDCDNELFVKNMKPKLEGLPLEGYTYKISCEGCGELIEFNLLVI